MASAHPWIMQATTNLGYYTIVIERAPSALTNEWNNFAGCDWATMVRGAFKTEQAATERAREMLIVGAPYSVRFVSEE